jgi:hypothetical protein
MISLRRSGPDGTSPSIAAIAGRWQAVASAATVFRKSRVKELRRHWQTMKESCALFVGAEQQVIAWIRTEARGIMPQWLSRFQVLAVPVRASTTGMLNRPVQPQTCDLVRTRSRKHWRSESSEKSKG